MHKSVHSWQKQIIKKQNVTLMNIIIHCSNNLLKLMWINKLLQSGLDYNNKRPGV